MLFLSGNLATVVLYTEEKKSTYERSHMAPDSKMLILSEALPVTHVRGIA